MTRDKNVSYKMHHDNTSKSKYKIFNIWHLKSIKKESLRWDKKIEENDDRGFKD